MPRKFLTILTCLALGIGILAAEDESAFGSSIKTAGTMLGIFYDLKQTQKRQPIPGYVDHFKTMGKFLDSGWDERSLSHYFRGTKPVYATEVLIPSMSADGAPAAFGLSGIVKPSNWFVIYKAQVSPPVDGVYRFVGIADDCLAVGVNGKTVLVSNFGSSGNYSRWKEPSPGENIKVWAGNLKRGDWFACKKDQIIDLDILIGEIPGNLFGAWLLIEKQGASYPGSAAQPLLPPFQVRARPIKTSPGGHYIPFQVNSSPWICHP